MTVELFHYDLDTGFNSIVKIYLNLYFGRRLNLRADLSTFNSNKSLKNAQQNFYIKIQLTKIISVHPKGEIIFVL